jgi:ABC-type transport system involved in Fe-S cluster assembly fused permease/ATPase subunit
MRCGQSARMSLVSSAILSFGPVLVAIVAAALILPRAWLASYAAFVIAATVLYADYTARYDDAALRSMFSALFSVIVVAALAAGLATRWALKSRLRELD